MPANTPHPSFLQPSNTSIGVWRYMDFAKYVELLKQRGLYFARLDTFSDLFEGSLSKADWEQFQRVSAGMELDPTLPTEWRGRYFDVYVGAWRRFKKEAYVSCWHMNPGESEAMWKLYAPSGYAIAVVSTYERLAMTLPERCEDPHLLGPYIGAVTYKDYSKESFDVGNVFSAVMHKRQSFLHEQECRVVIWKRAPGQWPEGVPTNVLDSYPRGVSVPLALESLIERVVVSPASPDWFSHTVRDVTQRYGFTFPVEQSMLSLPPHI